MNYIIFIIIFLSAVIAAQLGTFVFYNRKRVYLKGFLGLILSIFIYSLFYSFELISPSLKYMRIFTMVQYIGISSIPAFWVIMALEYTNKTKYIGKKLYIALFSIPAVLLILNYTDDYHHLFYKSYTATMINHLSIANIEPGMGYIVYCIYINICLLIGNIMYMLFYVKSSKVYKKRSFIIMITSFIPWIGYWIYMIKILPIKIDIVPIFLAMACLLYTYALTKSNIFETAAIARYIVFDNITEAILILDMDNMIIDMNKKAEQTFEKKSSMVVGKSIGKEFKEFKQIIEPVYSDEKETFNCEIEIKNKIYYFKGEITLIDSKENKGKIITLSDNTEQVLMIKKLKYYGTTDILTGVYNRNYFYEIANKKMQSCTSNENVSLLMMDIDMFKRINDTYGHMAGDIVLKKAMEICMTVLGQEHCIGRYGGEEFIILLCGTDERVAAEIGDEIRKQIELMEILYDANVIKITASFGIYSTTRKENLDCMIKVADEALYEAKNLGRNKIIIKTSVTSINSL